MSIEPRETIIKTRACGGECCDHDVDLKLNKNRIAYYYCNWCSHHQKWGRADSQKLIAMYLKTRKADAAPVSHIVKHVKAPANVKAEPANLNHGPNDGPKHFLFG